MGSRAAPTVSFRLLGVGEGATAPAERPWTERIVDVPDVDPEVEANARALLRDTA